MLPGRRWVSLQFPQIDAAAAGPPRSRTSALASTPDTIERFVSCLAGARIGGRDHQYPCQNSENVRRNPIHDLSAHTRLFLRTELKPRMTRIARMKLSGRPCHPLARATEIQLPSLPKRGNQRQRSQHQREREKPI